MKKIKNKGRTYRFSLLWRGFGIGGLFIFFLNYCEAQTLQAVAVNGKETPKLSGIYSSKKSEALPLNPVALHLPSLSKEERRIREKVKDSTNSFPSDFPINNQHYKEDIEKRTYTSRTFNDGQGGVVIQYSAKNINYLDNEKKIQPINTGLSEIFPLSALTARADVKHEKRNDTSLRFSPTIVEMEKERSFWAATHQPHPTYLYKDGSSAISLDEKNKIFFNRNCKINGFDINYTDYSVGEDGALINNVITGIDKKIVFYENTIETDYIIRQPINTGNQDLIISEEIELPDGYLLSPILSSLSEGGEVGEAYVVYSSDNKEKARFKAPVFYDANNIIVVGKYNLVQQAGKIILQIIIPATWLNDTHRVYPITIDPVVTGPVSNYPSVYMNSCEFPNYEKDSILITIPAEITITGFIVEDSYFADLFAIPTPTLLDGFMSLSTICGSVIFNCSDPIASSLPGTCYLVPGQDLKSYLSCCFSPSCSIQTFYLTHGLARTNLGPGCNQTYIFYSPVWPIINGVAVNTTFHAYIVGKTVETTQVEWSVFPTTVCSDSCSVFLEVNTNYGVPPYTITHPWATGSHQYGTAVGSCNSTGSDTIAITIPGCPTTCGTNSQLSIPPPVIVDVCGDTVTGLSPKSIAINPVPVATAPPVSVCSGSPLNIPVSSCVTGSSFQWTGSNGSSGTGNINDIVVNTGPTLITIDYSVIPTVNGCVGQAIIVSAEIDTLPVINAGLNDTLEPGVSTQLNASGGLNYLWAPSAGLSCTNCDNPIATPVVTTSYYVTGTNEYGCSSSDTINILVTQGGEVLYIPNSFSPNDNYLNDLFCVYGTSIRTIDIQIYDRWGEMVFRSNDIKQGWDGKFHGKNVEGGVYVYTVNCEWLSGVITYRNGIVTVLR